MEHILIRIVGVLCAAVMGSGWMLPEAPSAVTDITQQEADAAVSEPEEKSCPIPLEDWRLILVNRDHPLEDGYQMELVCLTNGMQVDARCFEDLTAMLQACAQTGSRPVVCSAYRTMEFQTRLYEQKIRELERSGMEHDAAVLEAGTVVAVPGTSEHHLGLAVDIVDQSYQRLDEAQEDTPVQQWLMEHCWEYGFILRYPNGKTEITGIIYEPWHYRYVGREVAMDLRDRGLCFEEYLELFS